MKTMEIQITLDDFKLIKAFYPEVTRKQTDSNDFIIGWSELMPVVHKILIEWIPESGGWPHEYTLLQKMLLGSRIKQVYTAVVEFIKWYNSTLK